ncbi:MAG: YncE family protein [Solirubrobacterales bacterium]|nr:YncE family protein [Solirubrobacterales bacterium]
MKMGRVGKGSYRARVMASALVLFGAAGTLLAAFAPEASAQRLLFGRDLISGNAAVMEIGTWKISEPEIELGQFPTGVYLNPDRDQAYITKYVDPNVSVVDLATNTLIGPGILPEEDDVLRILGVAFTTNGSRAFMVVDRAGNPQAISVIDTNNQSLVGQPVVLHNGGGLNAEPLVSPNGRRLYVSTAGPDEVLVFDTDTMALNGPAIPTGLFVNDLAMSPDGSQLYTANGGLNTISILDTATRTAAGADIPIPGSADYITLSRDGSRAYVSWGTGGGGGLAVVNLDTGTVIQPSVPGLVDPGKLAIPPTGNLAYVAHGADGGDSRRLATINLTSNSKVGSDVETDGGFGLLAFPGVEYAGRPILGKRFVARSVRGKVTTRCRGDRKFRPLREAKTVPVGCLVDTRKGTVSLVSATGKTGSSSGARFRFGLFRVSQARKPNAPTVLTLKGSLGCHASAGSSMLAARGLAPRAAHRRRGGRRLWGSGKGRYTTKGKYGSASVRGTTWLVQDRCNKSSLFRVFNGEVAVRDFIRKRTVLLRKGQSYVARARR